ncbi:MAG TPA: hypothetical protein VGD74_00525, partial [Vulgatibacter sp.]
MAAAFLAQPGCERRAPRPVVGGGGGEVLISIEPERSAGVIGAPLRLRISVFDRGGVPVQGERLTIESSLESDELIPDEGATDAEGILDAALTAATIGARTITARAGDSKGSIVVTMAPPPCEHGIALGGHPPLEPIWPSFSRTVLEAADLDGDGTCDFALFGQAPTENVFVFSRAELIVRSSSGREWRVDETIFRDGFNPQKAVSGDFDGDGTIDLAVASWLGAERPSGSRIDWLSADAEGTWRSIGSVSWRSRGVVTIARADVEGEGRTSLLIEHAGEEDAVLQVARWVDGAPSLGEAVPLADAEQDSSWLAADFDGDGKA